MKIIMLVNYKYKQEKITHDLHNVCGLHTDYEFITKSHMKSIEKKSKGKE